MREVIQAVEELQPSLVVEAASWPVIVEGPFALKSEQGLIDVYDVRIEISAEYPLRPPFVYETANRIPRTIDRHVFPDGNCCITVWNSWLAFSKDLSVRSFLGGAVYEYFLNQFIFEHTGKWRLGERSHGVAGIVEAFAEEFKIEPRKELVVQYLQSIAGKPRGHLACPCGSGLILRKCHQAQLHDLYDRFPEGVALKALKCILT